MSNAYQITAEKLQAGARMTTAQDEQKTVEALYALRENFIQQSRAERRSLKIAKLKYGLNLSDRMN